MWRGGQWRLLAAVLLAVLVGGDEMAFVDVSSDDNLVVRSLDVRMQRRAGIAGFWESDPMAAHDWALRNTTQLVFENHLAAAAAAADSSGAARRLRKLESVLQPLFAQLPKNEHGRLDRGGVRYAMQRYFVEKHGWSLKGVQPAGGAWIGNMPVTPDVRQLIKYIVPTYLIEQTFEKTGPQGADVRSLVVLVATIEHMVRSELMDTLFFCYSALGLETGRKLGKDEVDRVILSFLMVFAFGTDLEVSTDRSLKRAQAHLDQHHVGWQQLRAFVRTLLKNHSGEVYDFDSILRFLEDFADRYHGWQERDCSRARGELDKLAVAAGTPGRAPLANVKKSEASGFRTLFTEEQEYLEKLGAIEKLGDGAVPHVVVPNFLASQAMCLTTASFYTVCCASPCDQRLSRLGAAAAGPSTTVEKVVEVLSEAAAGLRDGPLRVALSALAEKDGGQVSLYGPGFAAWLHQAFPTECPLPGDGKAQHRHTNPRTADEWMEHPGGSVQETEELMMELADVLVRFTTLGLPDPAGKNDDDDEDQVFPRSRVYASRNGVPLTGERWADEEEDEEAQDAESSVVPSLFHLVVPLALCGLVASLGSRFTRGQC